jgi:hypothetical protein
MIRYIFSINPGRSGSHYLSELFQHAAGCSANHEPEPRLQEAEMVAFNHGDEAPMRALLPEKLAAMEEAAGGKVYVETTHFFIMGFGWLLPEHLEEEEMAAIIVRRDPKLVGEGWLRINRVPGTEKARHSVLKPGAAKNLSRPAANASPLELCEWHAREIYLRADAYRKKFPRVKYVEVSLEDLNDLAKVTAMFAACGLKPLPDLATVVGVPTNLKKKGNVVTQTLRRLRRSIAKRLGRE